MRIINSEFNNTGLYYIHQIYYCISAVASTNTVYIAVARYLSIIG